MNVSQPSDSYGFDGGGAYQQEQPIKGDNENILFAPAAPAINKKQRQKEKKARREAKAAGVTPKAKNSGRKTYDFEHDKQVMKDTTSTKANVSTPVADRSQKKRVVTPDGTPSGSNNNKPGSPPPLPPARLGDANIVLEEDDDVWYAKWWMSCFPDSFKNLMPKR